MKKDAFLDVTRVNPDPVAALAVYKAAVKDNEKAREALRRAKLALIELAFPGYEPDVTLTTEIGGTTVKAKQGVSYTVDEAALPSVNGRLPEGTLDNVIKWKPALVLREYKKLPKDQQLILDEAITKANRAVTITVPKVAES